MRDAIVAILLDIVGISTDDAYHAADRIVAKLQLPREVIVLKKTKEDDANA